MPSPLLFLMAILPLVYSAAVPSSLSARAEENIDVIRFQKCSGLYKVTDKGGFEQGQAAYWADEAITGPPSERVIFDMYTETEDFFYNGRGRVYNGKTDTGNAIGATFRTTEIVNPPDGLFIGNATRDAGGKRNFYNCFTASDGYEDEKYRTCTTHIKCIQKDALQLYVQAAEETVVITDIAPKDIYAKFKEKYDATSRTCVETPIELGTYPACRITFECKDNSVGGDFMGMLFEELEKFGTRKLYKHEHQIACNTAVPGFNAGRGCDRKEYDEYTIPAANQFVARSVPQTNARQGHEVAILKTMIDCDPDKEKELLCDLLGSVFSLVTMVPKFGKIGEFGGIATEVGCGLF